MRGNAMASNRSPLLAGKLPDYEFETDGCSGGMSDLWRRWFGRPPPWEGCCVRHDVRYWAGGTWLDRLRADWLMLVEVACSKKRLALLILFIAVAMFVAVRFGGSPYWNTSYRWGYGWDFERRRGYAQIPKETAVKRDALLTRYANAN